MVCCSLHLRHPGGEVLCQPSFCCWRRRWAPVARPLRPARSRSNRGSKARRRSRRRSIKSSTKRDSGCPSSCLETDGWLPRVFALFRKFPFGTATVAVAHQRAVSPLFHPTNEGFIEFPAVIHSLIPSFVGGFLGALRKLRSVLQISFWRRKSIIGDTQFSPPPKMKFERLTFAGEMASRRN